MLPFLTFAIYYMVLVYQQSKDIQATKKEPSSTWMVLYWVGFVTGGVTWLVLYALNGVAFKEMRTRLGYADDPMWIVALVLAILLPPVGQILWAAHYNDTIRTASGEPAGAVPRPSMAQAA